MKAPSDAGAAGWCLVARAAMGLVHVTVPPRWPALHGGDAPTFVPVENEDMTRKRMLDACF